MKGLLITGILLLVLGAAGMIWQTIPVEEEHSAEIFGGEISVTETHHERIPVAVSATLLGVGAVLTVVAGLRMRGGRAAA